MTSLGPNDCHPFCWLGIYSKLHKPKIKMHLKTFGSSQIEAQKTIYSFPGVVSPKSIFTHAAELLKKKNLGSKLDKLISNGCQIDNCYMGGMIAISVTKIGIYGCCC